MKKTMKKSMFLSIALMLSVSIFVSACGKSTDSKVSSPAPTSDNKEASTTTAASETIKLKWWGGTPAESGPQAVVDKWNAEHKDIQVEYVRFVNDDPGNTKLDTALLSNSDAPDLYVNYNDALLDRRIQAGMVEPLNDLITKTGFDVEGVIGSDNIAKRDDKIYYLPGAKSIQLMMINKASLDAIGEKVPTEWTWDEYAALAKRLTKSGQFGAFFDPTWEPVVFDVMNSYQPLNLYYAADGTSNFNSPAAKKGLELQKELLDAKALQPYAEGVANKINGQDQLLTGKVAMIYTGTYMIRYVKDDTTYPNRNFQVAFAPEPVWEKGKMVNSGGFSDNISINAKSPNKDAAMQFLAWYLNEGNQEMIPGGRIPSSKKTDVNSLADKLIGDKGQYFDKESFMNVLKQSYTFKMTTNTKGAFDIRKALFEEAEKYFMGGQDIDATIKNLKTRADEAIKVAK